MKIEKFYKEKIFCNFSEIIVDIIEASLPAKEVVLTPAFLKLGLSDSIILKLAKQGLIVLTDDLELHSYILGNGATAANMNLFRGEYLLKGHKS